MILVRLWFLFFGSEVGFECVEVCVVDVVDYMVEVFRFFMLCDFCCNVILVEKLEYVSLEYFEKVYVYFFVLVVIIDSIRNWIVFKVFFYEFFKMLYLKGSFVL